MPVNQLSVREQQMLQFTTVEEAQQVLKTFGPLGGYGARIFIPEMALDMPTPQFDETHLFHFVMFGNGFVANAGLIKNNIVERGGVPQEWASLKAEMQDRGMFIPWWVSPPAA